MYKIGKFCLQSRDAGRLLCSLLVILSFSFPADSFSRQLTVSDSALVQKVRQVILNDSRLPIDGISIAVLKGAIRLKGGVNTLAQKRWIEELIYGIPETKVVDNQLDVYAPNLDNDVLAERAKEQLLAIQNDLLDFSQTELHCKEGKITLKGSVTCLGAKLHAEEVLAVVPGIRAIENKLRVRDPEHDSDEKIKRAVVEALRAKIQMNRDFFIETSVVRGIVTLSGRLSSQREHHLAIRTTLFTPGTAEIVDKIEVLPR